MIRVAAEELFALACIGVFIVSILLLGVGIR